MTREQIEALKALAEAAIEADRTHTGLYGPGVWHVVEYGDDQSPGICVHSGDAWRVCFMATIQSQKDYEHQMAKAKHIAAANPQTVIGLLDRIERQHNDIGILIAMIESLEEATGEGPEEEDGVIFAQIRQSHNEAIALRRAKAGGTDAV